MRQNKQPAWHYDRISMLLHWSLAILLVGMIGLGWYMEAIEAQPKSSWYFALHKSFGLIAAALVLLRVIWRLSHQAAPLPITIVPWQAKAAHMIQGLLYLCMVLMPLTGFLGASFSKHNLLFFGLELPRWVEKNADVAEQLFNLHAKISWIFVALIALHLLAGLNHLIIKRDGVFQRMWP